MSEGAAGADLPRVTVAIPTHNRVGYLREAIESALAQEGPAIEVLVVDNASTDDGRTVAVAEAVARTDPRVRLVRNARNLGMVGNWNRAAELARGAYFVLLSDDDRLAKGMVARAAAVLDGHPAVGFVHGAARVIDGSGAVVKERYRPELTADFVRAGGDYLAELLEGNVIILATVMFRRAGAGAVPFEPRFAAHADYALWLRLLLENDAAFVAEPAADYRWHGEMMTHALEPVRRTTLLATRAEGFLAAAAAGRLARGDARRLRTTLARECARLARSLAGAKVAVGGNAAPGTGERETEALSFLGLALRLSKRTLVGADLPRTLFRLARRRLGLRA